ncbi:MAG TPA: 16S rRNA (cytidine(1402)-2'-O)-methyltransferase [Bryobacteraceae bacterium]|nr:16S rRNA (cytidine(1402)-2'-O)-methyltransferase [Bryobacteraceae bacterium]
MAGTLYLVSTPIGNLEDITHRALRVLKEAELVACEDTRRTRTLLEHYAIRSPMVSYHERNESARAGEILGRLLDGSSVALVSDAGTPLVSDPGYRLVLKAVEHGIPIQVIPGPSAPVAALAASGLPTDQFHFAGFLPAKRGQRRRALEKLKCEEATLVFFEAPHRAVEALEDIESVLGPRPMVLAREMTKLHEEFLRGSPAEVREALLARPAVKGEITLVVGKGEPPPAEETPLPDAVQALMAEGMARMDAIKGVARRRGLSKSEVYKALNQADSVSRPAGKRTFDPTKA